MKSFFLIITLTFSIASISQTNFYDFKVKNINGEEFSLNQLKGKKIMIVNVASKCGLTPQYTDLQELYELYKDKNFVIIGFPANNFLNQEPGTNEEIAEFCKVNYGVTFPIMEKISVKGNDIHPLYEWLTNKELNGVWSGDVTWNFQKFLIDENGYFIKSLSPRTSPKSDEVINLINQKN